MGNICSGCQRDKDDTRHVDNYSKYDKNIPISLFIEKQRIHYTDTVKNRQSKAYLDTMGDSNTEKPIRIEKTNGLQEFWKKNQKTIKGFNPTIRPSATYQIDNSLAYRYMNGSSDKFESAYYDTDVYRLHQAATMIQRWYIREKKMRINSSQYFNSSNNLGFNRTQASYSMNTIDLSVRQS